MDPDKEWNIYFLLFDDVEVLDFTGSFDVFSMANFGVPKEISATLGQKFKLYTVCESGGMVTALHGLKIQTDFSFKTCNPDDIDVLIIPGAPTTVVLDFIENNPSVIQWLADRLGDVPLVASVCVGALILAEAGGFDGGDHGPTLCTTHHDDFAELESILTRRSADARILPGARYTDNPAASQPRVLSSAGVSAGIDMAFYMLAEILGDPMIAAKTARIMEYNGTTNWTLPPLDGHGQD